MLQTDGNKDRGAQALNGASIDTGAEPERNYVEFVHRFAVMSNSDQNALLARIHLFSLHISIPSGHLNRLAIFTRIFPC